MYVRVALIRHLSAGERCDFIGRVTRIGDVTGTGSNLKRQIDIKDEAGGGATILELQMFHAHMLSHHELTGQPRVIVVHAEVCPDGPTKIVKADTLSKVSVMFDKPMVDEPDISTEMERLAQVMLLQQATQAANLQVPRRE